jgi:hypothetical protein
MLTEGCWRRWLKSLRWLSRWHEIGIKHARRAIEGMPYRCFVVVWTGFLCSCEVVPIEALTRLPREAKWSVTAPTIHSGDYLRVTSAFYEAVGSEGQRIWIITGLILYRSDHKVLSIGFCKGDSKSTA